ncbi:amino acid adenylation domain-containing protein [Nocardiopsis dassonvillei]
MGTDRVVTPPPPAQEGASDIRQARPEAVHAQIARQAAKTPDAIAVREGERTLRYGALDRAANRLAHRLRALGHGPGTHVAVRLPRSVDLVVCLLAVLRSGAAYVPLDPVHPPERARRILEEVDAGLLVTDRANAGEVTGSHRVLVLDDPAERAVADREPDTPPEVAVAPEDLAYVIYTSGSTGVPKGVMVTHDGLARYTDWARGALPVHEGAVLHSSIAYDLGLTSLYPPLAGGGTVTVVAEDDSGVEALAETVRRSSQGVLKMTPTHLGMLRRALPAPVLADTALCLVIGGEELRGEALAVWAEHAPGTVVVNSYGPSETTVACCAYVTRAGETEPGPVPIGEAIAGARLSVLDGDGLPVPDGEVGELHVGGPGVARGYVAAPALTAERFVPDPDGNGDRLYRTGDLVRRDGDGRLFFVGRADRQVKVLGSRVELAEVEEALVSHPDVREAVVDAVVWGDGERRLAAFVVGDGLEPRLRELRAHLAQRLPRHAVPGLWRALSGFPLLRNGKIDRASLPVPASLPGLGRSGALDSPEAEVVAGAYEEVLGTEGVGGSDDFFVLGGDSLMATRLAALLRQRLAAPVSVRDVFAARTVERLAARAASHTASRGGAASEPGRSAPEAAPLSSAPGAGRRPAPLSFGQRRMLFLDRLNGPGTEYVVTHAVRVRGELDTDALGRAWNRLVERHEAMRTRYEDGPGEEPVQVVDGVPEHTLVPEDVDPVDMLREEAGTPFDLARGPVFRVRLARVSAREHVLAITAHHIATDAWSRGVINRELSELYAAERAGRPARLPRPRAQYADFALWQRAHHADEQWEADRRYWREQLSGADATELPLDRPRPHAGAGAGRTFRFTVPQGAARRLEEVGRALGATPYMVYLAGYLALIARYTGRTDITLGTPTAGRDHHETEHLVGFFVNTLAIRVNTEGDPSFTELVRRVRDTAADAYAHSGLPFEQVVRDAGASRDTTANPLFHLFFAMQNVAGDSLRIPGARTERMAAPPGAAKFDCSLELTPRGDGAYDAVLEYAAELFEPGTPERLARHYVRLLYGAAEAPDTAVCDIPLSTEEELRALVRSGRGSERPRPAAGIPELVAAQAAATPGAIALLSDEGAVDYAELERRVDLLARGMRDRGLGAGDVAGVCLQRGPALVVCLLAILRVGAAYLPLDPDHPSARIGEALEETAAKLVVVDSVTRARVRSARTPELRIDRWLEDGATSGPVRWEPTDPDADAYVIHTSGSTGRPKGVVVPHRGIRNRVLWTVEEHGLGPGDRVLQKTAIAFDAAGWEVFAPLVCGATVVLPPHGAEKDPSTLIPVMAENRVTVLQGVPTFLRALTQLPDLERAGDVRLVFSAGEPLSAELADTLCERLSARLVNTYGPTECSIDVTAHDHRGGGAPMVPIGTPIHNATAWVFQRSGGFPDLAPEGVPGELYIGGEGLARGYFGSPRQTAERFVPNPLGEPGSRLFRSGDLARCARDGRLEFLGRGDQLVKIRGVRVEPGEVEAVLSAHPAVSAAAVRALPGPDGANLLVGYVVPGAAGMPSRAELRDHLLERLPDAYVPGVIVELDSLPLTVGGKVDRGALPEPDTRRRDLDREFVQLAGPTERRVASIWAEILDRAEVGANDDFFELGGHSLLAVKVTSRLRAELGVEVSVRQVFQERTVSALSRRVDRLARTGTASAVPRRSGPGRLSHAQERLWFLQRLDPGSTSYNVTWALEITGGVDPDAMSSAVDELVRRHEVLRTRYPIGARGEPFPEAVPPTGGVLEFVDPAGSGRTAEEHLLNAARTPFDLTERAPVVARLIDAGEGSHLLVLVVHHIACDARTEELFAEELTELYDAAVRGRREHLPEPSLQYADFAEWQRGRMESEEETVDSLDFWRSHLAGWRPFGLGISRTRPARPSGAGAALLFDVPAQTGAALTELGRARGATPFMTFLALFNALLARYSGSDDLVVGVPVSGRDRVELERVAGFFVNVLALRTDLTDHPSLDELIVRTRDTVLEAYSHAETPFERLVEELAPERDPSRHPFFDVLFEVREPLADTPRLHGALVRRVPVERSTAKYDLSLVLTARDDGGFDAELEYATDLFDAAAMGRFAGHFTRMAESAVADPGTPTRRLEILAAGERERILRDWAGEGTRLRPESVPALFEEQVARTPDATAVAGDDGELTYAELAKRARRLSARLRTAGVGTGSRVAVYLERSADSVVALLGVLGAGGVYAPMDPAQPRARTEQMVSDLGAAVVLTTGSLLRDATGLPAEAVVVDGLDAAEAEEPPGWTFADPEELAYVIHTSGSTGRPKGVMVSHRAFAHHCREIARSYGIGAGDRVAFLASPVFDVAMDQMGAPLVLGAAVVVGARDFWTPDEFPDRVDRLGVTHLEIAPAYYREVMEHVLPSDPRLSRLRLMNVGSEVVTYHDAARWHERALPGRFLCTYGPAEATVTCLVHPVTAAEALAGREVSAAVPIGRPVPGTRVYVLDAEGGPVPPGVAGELYIGGSRLARGYHGRPRTTAELFVPDPYGEAPGGRLYRTGDRARYRDDGTVEFLGRFDAQVKVRGFRVEPGEVEAALREHPDVDAVAVAVRTGTDGENVLVGYVVPRPGSEPSTRSLRSLVRERVPHYMVPGRWLFLPELPMTRSGKVDRLALPEPVPVTGTEQRAQPRDDIEKAIADVWCQVLGLPAVDVHEDFFAVGGHSLRAARVLVRLRELFALDIQLRLLFEARTVAEQAQALKELALSELGGFSDEEIQAATPQTGGE